MEQCRTKAELRALRAAWAGAGESVGLVPTMGYLHEGHLSLVRAARERCARVVVTIFVNPAQFGPNEDLESYPRDLDRDLALLAPEGVDAVFTPLPSEIYHPDHETSVETARLSRMLMGRLRPGHFRGVATVVCKLLNLAAPDMAFFGEKDYQQLAVIRRMVRDLDMSPEIVGVPTVREADGLAMSSRNVRLTPEHRAAAPALRAALREAETLAAQGAGTARMRAAIRARIDAAEGADIRAIDIRDAQSLAPLRGPLERPAVVLLAVRFGDVLLIDQHVVSRGA
ncbi:pantoate--beta-alanine ligase [Profundibacterium mesophilum]|uniref:Pantothenate synthetase n=1 Tax=Profundibacterium mesophilum KAUST100406-0324 TaxID=1037889 RepID=A0A921NV24_9RHOB|nr:pantoate--beta-alanine ligase [Profundibacterium mesophilum]KAF0677209.1 Pantothenate synthetase [Profundibacterium mesophilum KAUST100406-0324]